MVTKQQGRYLSRARKLKVFLNKNGEITVTYAAFETEADLLYKNLNGIEDELPQKNIRGNGATKAKDKLKKQVAEDCGSICGFAKSYAVATGNASLATAVNYRNYDIVRMKDSAIAPFTTGIYDLLTPLVDDKVFANYGVTQDMLDAMMGDAKTFLDGLGVAAVMDAESSLANKNIDAGLAAINGNIEQMNLLIPYFKTSNPDFVEGYKLNAKLDSASVLHSGIEGVVTNAVTGEPVYNAVISLVGTKKSVTTNLKGAYQLIKVPTKDYQVQISAPGLGMKTMIISILRGKILELNVAI